MTDGERVRITREQALAAAGEVYGAILADPERREQLRQARTARAAKEGEATREPNVE
jgi:hypothetical protein